MCLPTCHFFESPPLSRELSPEMLQLIFQMKGYRRKKRHDAQGNNRPRISKPAYNQTTTGPATQVFQENSEDVTPYMQNNDVQITKHYSVYSATERGAYEQQPLFCGMVCPRN